MISRRALFGTGAGVVVVAGAAAYADHTHRLDDISRRIGLRPHPEPAASDRLLIAAARRDQTTLLLTTQSVARTHSTLASPLGPSIANLGAQITALGGVAAGVRAPAVPLDPGSALAAVIAGFARAETDRSQEAMKAVSGEFAQVLAAIAAGLAQSLVALRKAPNT